MRDQLEPVWKRIEPDQPFLLLRNHKMPLRMMESTGSLYHKDRDVDGP